MKTPMRLPAIAVALVTSMLASAVAVHANAVEPAKAMALQGVMQQLGRDMQAVTGAISREDWPAVARLAPKIADHPQPPLGEKIRILTWLGTNAGQFRGFDGQIHDAATAMGEAAARGNGQAVIAEFAKVQHGCLGCHEGFRASYVEHFHPQR